MYTLPLIFLIHTGENKMSDILEIPKPLFDLIEPLKHSAKIGKYPPNNWLSPAGAGCSHKAMYASIFRHAAEAYCRVKIDRDSGLDPRLHLALRVMMDYTRDKLNIIHPDD